MSPPPLLPADDEKTTAEIEEQERHIYALGICILLAWIFVVILCASPPLFRDLIQRFLCCCFNPTERQTAKKVKEAQDRLRRVSQNLLTTELAAKPSSILLHQVMGPNSSMLPSSTRRFFVEPIIEENQKPTSLAPSENCALEMNDEIEEVSKKASCKIV